MKNSKLLISLLCGTMIIGSLTGCGKEKLPETTSIATESEDIYAKEGEIEEKKIEEVNEEIPVDAKFCRYCGFQYEQVQSIRQASAAPVRPAARQKPNAVQKQPAKKSAKPCLLSVSS